MPSRSPICVVHVPHGSLEIPAATRGAFLLDDAALAREQLLMTDHYTERLFALPEQRATPVVFPVSRLIVDPERFVDDEDEPMSARGMGVVYTRTQSGERLRAAPTARERDELLDRYYHPHHHRLTDAVTDALAEHDRCLIIDGHSFPSRPLPYEDDQRPDRPEICIGTDSFHTSPSLEQQVRTAFDRLGLSTRVNRPFAGSLVPKRYWQREVRVQSVMIEVNRGLYMDEETGEPNAEFEARCDSIHGALLRLIEEFAQR